MSDVIAAISTGSQLSAIGIIRLSGPGCLAVADRVFRPHRGAPMSRRPDRLLVLGDLLDTDGAVLDVCLCTVSRAPHSYTGEDTAELQCHGSPTVLRRGLEALFAAGARQALAGEFTKRAFLNGCMDLTQAEAVIDLINAETAAAAKNAAGQLGGAILRKTDRIYDSLVDIISHFHAVLDYPDEDIEPFEIRDYLDVFQRAHEELCKLKDSFDRGRVLQSGVPAAIIGRPNAGKSSLLNALLGFERAIVTDIPGTTRDTIQEKVSLGGVLLRLTDTAGLRATGDPVERLGVERAESAAREAELVLAVFDGSQPLTTEDRRVAETAAGAKNAVAVVNKNDLPPAWDPAALEGQFTAVCSLSAREGEGLEELARTVAALYPAPESAAGEILTNARHFDAVSRADAAVLAAREALEQSVTPDAVLTELEGALSALGELTGRTVREDVTARIFERFCVGK